MAPNITTQSPPSDRVERVSGARKSRRRRRCIEWLLVLAFLISPAAFATNVREQGALGDGKTLDTASINKAIEACVAGGGGQVIFPPGRYLTGTIHLKSNIALLIQPGAEIVGVNDPEQYEGFTPPAGTPLANRLRWHRSLILGVGVENVTIIGGGVIDGNKVFDARGEERMRGPHAVLFGNSKGITIRDVQIKDAANYAVMLEFTSQVRVERKKVTGGGAG